MLTGTQLKQNGVEQVSSHNPDTLQIALDAISTMRKCRLRINSKYIGVRWDEVFTVEELVNQIRSLCKYPIPTNLNGSIGQQAKARNLIEKTGQYVKAKRDVRHDGEVPQYRWATDRSP